MPNFKQKRIRDKKHLKFIASLPCCVSGAHGITQAAHIRHGVSGIGIKPCDRLTVPLSYIMHDRQHQIGELKFWGDIDGIEKSKNLAMDLYEISGDRNSALILIAKFRMDK